MKTKTFIFVLSCLLTTALYAQQWSGSGTSSGVIHRTGNVGIGTTTPGHKFHVKTNAGNFKTFNTGIEFTTNTTGGWARALRFRNENDQLTSSFGVVNGNAFISTDFDPIQDATGFQNRKFVVLKNGNVGIGTTQPDKTLTVAGGVNIGGTGNAGLTVRHINGKSNTSTAIDDLYINYNSGKRVFIGYGGQQSDLLVNGSTYVNGGWVRVHGSKGLFFQNYGGGVHMQDNTWVRIYGDKSFYHKTGIMRTDGSLQVGSGGSKFLVQTNGNVGIGTTSPNNKLDVNGTIRAKEVRVQSGWSDHVFLPEYELPTLIEEEKHIAKNGHLLGFESEAEMDGEIKLAEVTNRQQVKIEELMLHMIELNKQVAQLKTNNQTLTKELKDLKANQ